MLTATRLVKRSRYCSTVDHRPGSGGHPSRPALISTNASRSAWEWNGAYEHPSLPLAEIIQALPDPRLVRGSARSTPSERAYR
jgi:hypothetical protein